MGGRQEWPLREKKIGLDSRSVPRLKPINLGSQDLSLKSYLTWCLPKDRAEAVWGKESASATFKSHITQRRFFDMAVTFPFCSFI